MEQDKVTVTQPALAYRVSFLLGGAAFAIIAYVLGTVLYRAEQYLPNLEVLGNLDLPGAMSGTFQDHLLSFVLWVVGTAALFITLGYFFDKQVKYRRRAEELRSKAESLAVTDGLTLVFNHRYLIDQLTLEVKRTNRFSRTFALLFLDIDCFKAYNDTHGHQAGDDVLRQVALVSRATARETDLVARYGGEEFVIIATGTDKEKGALLAERIRALVERKCPVTVSIGVAGFPEDGASVEDLIRAADQAMYEAKGRGKNMIRLAFASPAASCSAVVEDAG